MEVMTRKRKAKERKFFEDMRARIREYFSKVSDKQLKADLKKANYDFYRDVKTKVI